MRNELKRYEQWSRRERPRRAGRACAVAVVALALVFGTQQTAFGAGCTDGATGDSGCAVQTDTPTPTTAPGDDGDDDGGATSTPTPSATPTPTPTPTPKPTPTPTPAPTPTHTPTPTPTPTPSPTAPAPTDQVPLEPSPVFDNGATLDEAQLQQASQLASDLASAQQTLADATQQSIGVQREKDQADASAKALAAQAKTAKKQAQQSAAFATALIRSEGSRSLTMDPLAAALASPGNLLDKLGAVDRFRSVTSSREAAMAAAKHDAQQAATLRARAAKAQTAADGVDLDGSEQAVADAQTAVDTAESALASLPTLQAAGVGWRALVDVPVGVTGWVLPVHGPLTDVFGPRPSRPAGTALFHPGDDIGAGCGSTIVAAAAGTVVDAGPNGSYGNFVMIDHGGGVATAYGHIVDGGIGVTAGETVAAGQPIALVGSTGASTGCHLHFEVRVNGVQIDPLPFMAARGVTLGTR